MNEQQQYAFRESAWPLPANDKAVPIERGDAVTSFRGTEYTFESVNQYAGDGSQGRVSVIRQCVDFNPEAGKCPHYWHTDSMDREWFYPSVVGLYLGTADGSPVR